MQTLDIEALRLADTNRRLITAGLNLSRLLDTARDARWSARVVDDGSLHHDPTGAIACDPARLALSAEMTQAERVLEDAITALTVASRRIAAHDSVVAV